MRPYCGECETVSSLIPRLNLKLEGIFIVSRELWVAGGEEVRMIELVRDCQVGMQILDN